VREEWRKGRIECRISSTAVEEAGSWFSAGALLRNLRRVRRFETHIHTPCSFHYRHCRGYHLSTTLSLFCRMSHGCGRSDTGIGVSCSRMQSIDQPCHLSPFFHLHICRAHRTYCSSGESRGQSFNIFSKPIHLNPSHPNPCSKSLCRVTLKPDSLATILFVPGSCETCLPLDHVQPKRMHTQT